MTDLEQRVRRAFTEEAERFQHRDRARLTPPRMSPPIRRRVRRRQVGSVLVSLVVVAGLIMGSIGLVRAIQQPEAATPMFHPPTGTQAAPAGWPRIVFGGTSRPEPTYSSGERQTLIGSKKLVAYGTARDGDRRPVAWNVFVYEVKRGLYPDNTVIYFTQWCSEFGITEFDGSGGGGGSCGLPRGGEPGHRRYMSVGTDSGSGRPLVEVDGSLSTRVTRVQVLPNGFRPFDLRVLPGPPGVPGKFFLFFAPKGVSGRIVAYDETGRVLQQESFCAADVDVSYGSVTFPSIATGTSVSSGTTTTSGSTTTAVSGSGSVSGSGGTSASVGTTTKGQGSAPTGTTTVPDTHFNPPCT